MSEKKKPAPVEEEKPISEDPVAVQDAPDTQVDREVLREVLERADVLSYSCRREQRAVVVKVGEEICPACGRELRDAHHDKL